MWNFTDRKTDWVSPNSKELHTIRGNPGFTLAFSDDRKLLACADDAGIHVFDVQAILNGRTLETADYLLQTLPILGTTDLAFSHDGSLLVAGTADGRLVIWDVGDGKPLDTYTDGPVFISQVSFSPDSRHLVSIARGDSRTGNPTATVWEVSSSLENVSVGGKILARIQGATSAAFSPDGTTLVLGNIDGSISWNDLKSIVSGQNAPQVGTIAAPVFHPLPDLQTGQPITLSALRMIDPLSGWAIDADGRILHTVDGGNHWQNITPPDGPFSSMGFAALDADSAWAVSNQTGPTASGVVWQTTDRGRTWQASQPFPLGDTNLGPAVPYSRPIALQFMDARNGWLAEVVNHRAGVDDFRLFKSMDGGATWVRVTDQRYGPALGQLSGAAFMNSRQGWLAGVSGDGKFFAVRSFDTGQDWSGSHSGFTWPDEVWYLVNQEKYGFKCNLAKHIEFISPDSIGVELQCVAQKQDGTEIRPLDLYFLIPEKMPLWNSGFITNGTYFLNSSIGWRFIIPEPGLSNQISYTEDGGLTWKVIRTVAWNEAQFDFVTRQIGWAIVSDGTNTALVHTTNGGSTWSEIKPVVADH